MKNTKRFRYAAPLLAVTAVLAALLGSYAWFYQLMKVRTEEIGLHSESQLVSINEYAVYMYEEAEGLNLKSYDTVFGRNSQTPVYFLVPVTGAAVDEGSALEFTAHATETLWGADNTHLSLVMSNVMQLRGKVITAQEAQAADYDALYAQMHGGSNDDLPVARFATYSVNESGDVADGASKHDAVLQISGYQGDVENGVGYVLLELDYNRELLLSLLANHVGGSMAHRLDSAQMLEIENDISSITVTAAE